MGTLHSRGVGRIASAIVAWRVEHGRLPDEGDRPVAEITANRSGLRRLIEDLQMALAAEEGMAVQRTHYLEIDGREFDLWVRLARTPRQMGEPREPERPDRSMFTKRLRQ